MSKPKKIFLLRHGQSEANVDKTIYSLKPDYAVNLTPMGERQAFERGQELRELIGDLDKNKLAVYYSPFFRTIQTFNNLAKAFPVGYFHERWVQGDPRLREQEWVGGIPQEYDGDQEALRDTYGHFYYRFQGGESCADVYDRVASFNNTLHRDFEKSHFPEYCLICGHGMTNRVFLMKWFHLSVEEFEIMSNPKNCELWTLELNESTQKYKLTTDIRKDKKLNHNYRCELIIP